MNCNRTNRHADNGLINQVRGGRSGAILSAAEEVELARAIARGDKAAKDRMILANLGLVRKIARDYLGRGLDLDDLIGEGHLGLIRAAEEFDPEFGTRFSTYAAYWIREAMRHALINNAATIRIPAHVIGLMTKCHRIEIEVRCERGYKPTPEEVASRLGLTDKQMKMVAKARLAGRIEFDGASDEEGVNRIARATDQSLGSPGSGIEGEEDRRALRAGLERLDEKERAVLVHRFGLDGQEPATFQVTGGRMGVTREWARKLEIRALGKLGRERVEESKATRHIVKTTA